MLDAERDVLPARAPGRIRTSGLRMRRPLGLSAVLKSHLLPGSLRSSTGVRPKTVQVADRDLAATRLDQPAVRNAVRARTTDSRDDARRLASSSWVRAMSSSDSRWASACSTRKWARRWEASSAVASTRRRSAVRKLRIVRRSNWSAAAGGRRGTDAGLRPQRRGTRLVRGRPGGGATDELRIDRLPLAQQVARTEDGENDFAAVGRVEGDLDPALEDDADNVVAAHPVRRSSHRAGNGGHGRGPAAWRVRRGRAARRSRRDARLPRRHQSNVLLQMTHFCAT